MAEQEQANDPQFQIERLYIKDVSFEIPNGSSVFRKEWKPELNINLNTTYNNIAQENVYEVILTVQCEVKCDQEPSFNLELQQAGLFSITDMGDEQLNHALHAFCPSILYPYAREAIADIVAKSGFPQLNLAPVNFDSLYQQKKANEATQKQNEHQQGGDGHDPNH